MAGEAPSDEFEAEVKIRYRAAPQPAEVLPTASGVELRFREPQRAVTAGQAAVFYRGNEVLGGGIIANVGS